MFKRLFIAAILSVLMIVPVRAHAEGPKVAIVDVDKMLSEAKAAKSLQSQIQAKKDTFQKEFSAKEKELKAIETTLIQEKEKLSAEEFAKKRKAYEEKIIETRKLFQKTRNSLDEGLAKSMQELRKNIVEATAQVADEKGYDIVLTRESVIIAEKSLDITPDVLKKLDANVQQIKLQVQ